LAYQDKDERRAQGSAGEDLFRGAEERPPSAAKLLLAAKRDVLGSPFLLLVV